MKSFSAPAAAAAAAHRERRQPSDFPRGSSRTTLSRRDRAMIPPKTRSTRRRRGSGARVGAGLNSAIVDVRVERLVLGADDAKEEAFEVVRATATTTGGEQTIDEDKDGILCLCVPGNPGVAEYYSNFARALSEALLREEEQQQKSVTVECVGFLGHYCDETLTSAKTRRWFTLEEQKAHVLKYVRSRVEEEKKRNGENACFLVGHSIGAHVAMHAVKEMREEDVKRMVGLMPFLHVNEKSNVQKFLAWLVSLRVVVRAVAYVLGFMQKFKVLKKMIEKSATRGMKCELGISVTKRWAREMSLVNMALMGDTEFKFLRDWKGNVVDVLKAHAKKISFVYACKDHWGPLHQRDELIKEIGEELEIITDENYEHAFVLDDESSNKLASQCARMLLNN
jgi:hypothetical protein